MVDPRDRALGMRLLLFQFLSFSCIFLANNLANDRSVPFLVGVPPNGSDTVLPLHPPPPMNGFRSGKIVGYSLLLEGLYNWCVGMGVARDEVAKSIRVWLL